MNKLKNYKFAMLIGFIALSFTACKKDDPIAEIPAEEVGTAELSFLEVEAELHNDHYHYHDIAGAVPLSISFDQAGLAPVGTHAHLTEGKTYKVSLKAFDFAKREMQQEFVDKADLHQAFLLGAPDGVLTYVYADRDAENKKVNVGVTGYLTVNKATAGFTFRYVLRHLNPGVKASLTAQHWNATDFASRFSGANDLDLKFNLHPVAAGDHDH
jgi:hypothetical protein